MKRPESKPYFGSREQRGENEARKEKKRKERDEEVPEVQEKGEQEEGRERSRRAAAVKATQTLQANESVSVTSTWEAQGQEELDPRVWDGGQSRNQDYDHDHHHHPSRKCTKYFMLLTHLIILITLCGGYCH